MKNGKRKLLIPTKETQELVGPIAFDNFADLIDLTTVRRTGFNR